MMGQRNAAVRSSGAVNQNNAAFRHSAGYPIYRNSGFALGFGGFGAWGNGFQNNEFVGNGFAGNEFPGNGFEQPGPDVPVTRDFPATLAIQFPATAQMWMGGKSVNLEELDEHELLSPALKPGEQYTFAVKIRWSRDGKTFEANRSVTLGAGERSRLLIVSGDEVKE